MTDRKKQGSDNQEWGHEAETLAAEYFLKNGYTIRERNWKSGNFEIDLILEKNRQIVFVEVKARKRGPTNQDPVAAVDYRKRRRLIMAADSYLRQLTLLYQYRFDIVTFTGTKNDFEMRHYPDAFIPLVNECKKLR